jgi:uncharacterized phage protein (TIGR02218 family)
MKSISPSLESHLDQEVTTIATCWLITRQDGVQFGFTDHDRDLVVDGITYQAESSYSRTAVTSGSDFSVDNLEVSGILDSEILNETEMRNGLFNRADVYIFVVNWMNLSQGHLKIRRGWFGEVTLQSNGTFTTEIRGLTQAISHNFIELFSPECRADFCDSRCKLNIVDYEDSAVVETSPNRETILLEVGYTAPTQGLSFGTVEFVDGENAGRSIEIIGYNSLTRQVDLFEPLPYAILPGTLVKVAPGCDKSLARCKDYDNVINRQAEDYVPGNDELLQYPDAQ